MKCISCESEINPKFKHAIEQNMCPFCGGSIMEELLKSLLVSLADTMQKMKEYPEQLDDWLFSNYGYIKTDSPDLIKFVPKEQLKELRKEVDNEDFVERKKKVIKVKVENGKEVEAITEKIQSDARTAGFFERAQIIKRGEGGGDDTGSDIGDTDNGDTSDGEEDVQLVPIKSSKKPRTFKSAAEKTRHLKELKKKIETEGAQAVVGETGLAAMIDPENLENADPEMVAAFQSELGDGDIITSALPVSSYDDEDAMADQILTINQSLAGKKKSKSGDYNEADVRALREMHNRVAKSKEAFETGENRGGKGGGFSRV
jgi:hypothetical protein